MSNPSDLKPLMKEEKCSHFEILSNFHLSTTAFESTSCYFCQEPYNDNYLCVNCLINDQEALFFCSNSFLNHYKEHSEATQHFLFFQMNPLITIHCLKCNNNDNLHMLLDSKEKENLLKSFEKCQMEIEKKREILRNQPLQKIIIRYPTKVVICEKYFDFSIVKTPEEQFLKFVESEFDLKNVCFFSDIECQQQVKMDQLVAGEAYYISGLVENTSVNLLPLLVSTTTTNDDEDDDDKSFDNIKEGVNNFPINKRNDKKDQIKSSSISSPTKKINKKKQNFPIINQTEKGKNQVSTMTMLSLVKPGPNKTAIVYDEIMTKHFDPDDRNHPERPERIISIWNHLQRDHKELSQKLCRLASRMATQNDLELVHTKEHIQSIKTGTIKFDCYWNENATYESALYSAGSVLQLVDHLCGGKIRNGFAICRPPGHHATATDAMGFCYFNNVAIAASYAIKKYNLSRVLIFDPDIHHGNGTQDIFYESNKVLVFSIHKGPKFYPGTGFVEKIGKGKGLNFNVNVPLSNSGNGQQGFGDGDFLMIVNQLLIPICLEWQPELILISQGFDAVEGDLLGDFNLTPEGFGMLVSMLMPFAQHGKIALALEGGYNLQQIARCAYECIRVLNGESPKLPNKSSVVNSATWDIIAQNIDLHRKQWKLLRRDFYSSKTRNY